MKALHIYSDLEKMTSGQRMVEVTTKPLTREAAQSMGHVAWVDESNPRKAIREMVDRVMSDPTRYNCAVWPGAAELTQPASELLTAWRKIDWTERDCAIMRGTSYCKEEGNNNLRERLLEAFRKGSELINGDFNQTPIYDLEGSGLHERGLAVMSNLINTRMEQIIDALDPSGISPDLRPNESDSGFMDIHLDGGGETQFRLVETFCGSTTEIFDNKDVVFFTHPNSGSQHCRVAKDGITAWRTPPYALTLITGDGYGGVPVAHGRPLDTRSRFQRWRHASPGRIFMNCNVAL